jgi:hypothetical protein
MRKKNSAEYDKRRVAITLPVAARVINTINSQSRLLLFLVRGITIFPVLAVYLNVRLCCFRRQAMPACPQRGRNETRLSEELCVHAEAAQTAFCFRNDRLLSLYEPVLTGPGAPQATGEPSEAETLRAWILSIIVLLHSLRRWMSRFFCVM